MASRTALQRRLVTPLEVRSAANRSARRNSRLAQNRPPRPSGGRMPGLLEHDQSLRAVRRRVWSRHCGLGRYHAADAFSARFGLGSAPDAEGADIPLHLAGRRMDCCRRVPLGSVMSTCEVACADDA